MSPRPTDSQKGLQRLRSSHSFSKLYTIHPQAPPQRILLPLLYKSLAWPHQGPLPRLGVRKCKHNLHCKCHSLQSGPPQEWLNSVRDIDLCRFAQVSAITFGCWRSQSPLVLRVLAVLFPRVNRSDWLIFLFTAQFSQRVPKQPVRLLHELLAPQKPNFS